MEQGAAPAEPVGSIKPINRQSIHRICSGQVILDLATAIKELVENALDAGATNIEVRLREYGSALVEVADNGRGVPPADHQALTLKYHTSKISSFDDLTSVSTYGFRGEALSSLCAVSELSVVTRTAEQTAGVRLEYDHEGVLTTRSPAPRAVGTTVAVKNLFATLPVRHKEFLRNLKREFARAVAVLQAYALIATHARLIVTNQAGKGSARTTVFTTAAPAPTYEAYAAAPAVGDPVSGVGASSFPGCLGTVLASAAGASASARVQAELAALRDNVVAVFGGRVAESLEPLVLVEDPETGVQVVGWVSRAGCGLRGDASRQFFFLNGRPVDLPKAARVLNDSFKSLSSPAHAASCRAMAVLAVSLAAADVDVNVTPDKRRVFMAAEDRMVTLLQQALHTLWEPSRCTFTVNQPLQAGPAGTALGGRSSLVAAQGGVQRGAQRQQQQRQLQLNVQRGPAPSMAAPSGASADDGDDEGGTAGATAPTSAAAEEDVEAPARKRAAKRARVTGPAEAPDGKESPKAQQYSQQTTAAVEPSPGGGPGVGTDMPEGRAVETVTAAARPAPFRHPFLSMLSGFAAVAGKGGGAQVLDSGHPSSSEPQSVPDGPDSAAANADAGQGANGRQDRRRRLKHTERAEQGDEAPASTSQSEDSFGEGELAAQPRPVVQCGQRMEPDVDTGQPDFLKGHDGQGLAGEGAPAHEETVDGGDHGVEVGMRASRGCTPPEERTVDSTAGDTDMPDPDGREAGLVAASARELRARTAEEGPGCAGDGTEGDGLAASQPLPSPSLRSASAPVAVLRLEPGQLATLTAARVRHLKAQLERRREDAGDVAGGDGGGAPSCTDGAAVRSRKFTSSSLEEDIAGGVTDEAPAAGGTRAEREAAAERELERVFRKQQFREMKVLGQFNLGFILARHGADVFIVDQHAAAEKTTFERLQRTVVLTRQPLLVPMALPPGLLLPVDQLLIRDHIDVFRRNGFDFVERRPDGRLVPLPGARGQGPLARRQGQQAQQQQLDMAAAEKSGAAGTLGEETSTVRHSVERPEGIEEVEGWAEDMDVDAEGPAGSPARPDGGRQNGIGDESRYDAEAACGSGGGEAPGGELLLASVPVSRATGQLGMEDVVELVALLRAGEGPGGGAGGDTMAQAEGAAAARQRAWEEELRPSRIRAMLASRACRSSIMVGRPLNRSEMRRLLDGLAELRQPWNCPHGRPTMRHVCVLPPQPGLSPA